jgi:hypothetical protein
MLRNNDPTKPRVHGSDHINGQEDPIPGALIFIDSIETDSSEKVSSTSENTIQTISLPANSYNKILIEAGVRERYEVDVSNKTDNTWRIKVDGVLKKTFTTRIIALATSGADSGGRYSHRISTIVDGGQTTAVNITITGQMTVSNANCGLMVYYLRLWGINRKIRP